DDDAIRHLIALNLELEGFEVHTAVDGPECLRRVGEVDPAVVTLDVMMPRMDGWEVAARLRSNPATQHVKILMLTARAQDADRRRGSDLGVDQYLTKPFEPDDLVSAVRALAAAVRAPREDTGDG
ncbi:MAG TPA: response regulator, partial [Mycobacteriales bacterium]|nr:response regulator [Mycobacteriales bacterium]